MPYNTVPQYHDLSCHLGAVGDPDVPKRRWADARAESVSVGPLTDPLPDTPVRGWMTLWKPAAADAGRWPIVYRAPVRALSSSGGGAGSSGGGMGGGGSSSATDARGLTRTRGRPIHLQTNPDAPIAEATLAHRIVALDGGLHCRIAEGMVEIL
jgi:hypothetical protein